MDIKPNNDDSLEDENIFEWKIYYWPGYPGRAEFARLLFIETDTPFLDIWNEDFNFMESVNDLR
jgi:hypothetical protein